VDETLNLIPPRMTTIFRFGPGHRASRRAGGLFETEFCFENGVTLAIGVHRARLRDLEPEMAS